MASKCSGSGIQSSPGSLLPLLALPGDACRQAVLLDTPSPSALPRLVHKGLQQPPSGSEPCPALAGRSQSPGVDFHPVFCGLACKAPAWALMQQSGCQLCIGISGPRIPRRASEQVGFAKIFAFSQKPSSLPLQTLPLLSISSTEILFRSSHHDSLPTKEIQAAYFNA